MLLNSQTIKPVTEKFSILDKTKEKIKHLKPNFGFNGQGEFVFMRTYSRDGENWGDVVIRVIEGVLSIRKEHYMRNNLRWVDSDWQTFASDMALSMFDMEWLPPGRGLWMMGTEFVYQKGAMALNNCGACDTSEDIVHAAEWCMDALMNGVGVGFNTMWRGEITLPNKEDQVKITIDDSREGWVDSLISLMSSYIHSKMYGKNKYPVFDYSQIRSKGQKINGFGGVASGPEPLKKLHEQIESYMVALYNKRLVEKTLVYKEINGEFKQVEATIDKEYDHTRFIADVFNSIGACVVAGNVRRSAQISLGDITDDTFINLKNFTENPERGAIAGMSNNSVVLKSDNDYNDFTFIPKIAKRVIDNGEPGVINLHNIQRYGRYMKPAKDEATLVNPCSEIPLCSFELCNLSETFPMRCANQERFMKALEFATFYSSTVSLLPTHRPETNAIIAKNRRIGVSISGIAQWVSNCCPVDWGLMDYTRLTSILRKGYNLVRTINSRLAEEAGVPASIRVTTVKPSGSISLLTGSTPGMHYPVSRYAIRRIRVGDNSPLIPALIKAGVKYEKDVYSQNTLVFSFAIDHGDLRPCDKVSPWEQFSLNALLQRVWSDNMVSCTIYFDKEKDASSIESLLAMFIPQLKSVSLLPHAGHNYQQAPYEPISKDEYITLRDSYTDIDYSHVTKSEPEGEKYCSNDTCGF
jgi:ribonucleoside-triphosphate reductase